MPWFATLIVVLCGAALIVTECFVRYKSLGSKAVAEADDNVAKLAVFQEQVAAAKAATSTIDTIVSAKGKIDEVAAPLKTLKEALGIPLVVVKDLVEKPSAWEVFSTLVKRNVFLAVGVLLLLVPILAAGGFTIGFDGAVTAPDPAPTVTVTPAP